MSPVQVTKGPFTRSCRTQAWALWCEVWAEQARPLPFRPFMDASRFQPTSLAWADEAMVGGLHLAGTHVELLYVSPSSRFQGVGRALLQAAVAEGARTLNLDPAQRGARAFYETLGFRPVDEAPLGRLQRADGKASVSSAPMMRVSKPAHNLVE